MPHPAPRLRALLLSTALAAAALAAASAEAAGTAEAAPPAVPAWEGRVTGIWEGDVIEITGARGPVAVRLVGVDCPERGQEFAKIARRFTSRAALGEWVRVEESGEEGGLPVARVVLPGRRDLSSELMRSGLAWWDRARWPSLSALGGLEAEARARYAGLWAEVEPVAPWEWRARPRGVPVSEVTLAPADTLIPVIQPARYR